MEEIMLSPFAAVVVNAAARGRRGVAAVVPQQAVFRGR
jgi:hypothetical protein